MNTRSSVTLQRVIAEEPFPLTHNSTSTLIAQTGFQACAEERFERPRSSIVYIQALTDPPKNFLNSGATLFWLLGQIQIGIGGIQHVLTFDLPLRQLLAIPVSAETIRVNVKLIAPFTDAAFVPLAAGGNSGFSLPPDPVMPAAGLTVAPRIFCGIAQNQNGVMSPATLTRMGIAQSAGALVQFPIADGCRGIQIYGPDAPVGTNTWRYQTQGGADVIGLPLNATTPIWIPPNNLQGQIDTAANARFLVVQTMGF